MCNRDYTCLVLIRGSHEVIEIKAHGKLLGDIKMWRNKFINERHSALGSL